MTVNGSNALDAIRFAIQLERDAVALYEAAQEKVATPSCRALFKRLADFERAHLHYLASLNDELEGSGSWIAYERVRGIPRETSGPRSDAELLPDLTETALRDTRAALTAAIEAEHKACDFYRQAAETSAGRAARATFELLMHEEKGHIGWLQEELATLPD